MIFLHKVLAAFIALSLLSCPVSTGPLLSLWGKVANFTLGCSHWRLKPHVSIPALQELTVCFSLKLEARRSLQWTAFTYRDPVAQYPELGLEVKEDRLVVWLFGTEWTTPKIDLHQPQWHALCLTWSHMKDRPELYFNGNPVELWAVKTPPCMSTSSCTLAPNGSLTLGVGHFPIDGIISPIPYTGMLGQLSLFRMWGRERSKHEVTSLNCSEGELVKWESDNWDTQLLQVLLEEFDVFLPPSTVSDSFSCKWSKYEVRLMFAISRLDGNQTELYTARDIAHCWLREVLPPSFYLPSVSVFEVTRSSTGDLVNTSHGDGPMRWAGNVDRFHCLVHVTVAPGGNVADVQKEIYMKLQSPYTHPASGLGLLPDANSIHTTPLESFAAATDSSPVTTSPFLSTTTPKTPDPSFTTSSANVSELYFEVKVNVSLKGNGDPEQILSTWLNSSLSDDLMIVLDLQLLPKAERHHLKRRSSRSTSDRVFPFRVSRESCVFQVQVMMLLSDAQKMEERIRQLLLTPYNNGDVCVEAEDVQISRILIVECNAETRLTRKGLFAWPDTSGGKNATRTCPKNPQLTATRHCKLCLNTHWLAPNLDDCPPVVETIPDLDHIEVTADNALDIVEMIEDLLRNHSSLSCQELVTILSKLEDIVKLNVVTPILGQALIDIISDILESDSDLVPFTNTILNITEAVGDNMVGYEGSSTLVAPALAISVVDVGPEPFGSLTFGVSSDRAGTNPEIFINRYPFNGTVAFIALPSVLKNKFPQYGLNQNPPRVQFQFFGIPGLFKSSPKGQNLNSFVVSASVTNASAPIKDLSEDIKVTLHHIIPTTLSECVYWNFNKNDGHGDWDAHGCRKYNGSADYTTCLCDHLTHFGVLLDVSRTPLDPANEQILTIITYLGCGVSSLFLGITILTYTAFRKLRRDNPSKILINLSLALLGLNLVFLVNSWLSSWGVYGLCVAVASTMHYFLLASFTWMALEAVNMYFALIKVFNVYVSSYILKFCALGWGLPLGICILVLIVNREAYGSQLYTDTQSTFVPLDNSDNFCWLQDNVTFYVSVVAYAALVFLFNIGVFVVVLNQIRRIRDNSPAGTRRGLMRDLRGVASLTLLLGLTWTVGFFTWGPARIVLLYLFSVLNTLQGLFIFLFHCLGRENVRKQWRIHLCFGRFRLEEYSEWRNSASLGAMAKPKTKPPVTSVPSVRSVKSSSTDSTSASDTSQRDSSCRRPNLGLFVDSLALPRAQRSPSGTGALPLYRGTNPTPGWRNDFQDQEEQR